MFKYACKSINKWLNNNIQLHFIMKHFNMTQRRELSSLWVGNPRVVQLPIHPQQWNSHRSTTQLNNFGWIHTGRKGSKKVHPTVACDWMG